MLQTHRISTLSLILLFVIAVAVGGWILGARIQSPAEAAARTAPPIPSPILVPVEQQVLTSDIVTRGTARFGLPQTLALVPSTLKGDTAIITTLPERGVQFEEGDLLLTASERPVFLLQGDTPVYRDLVAGTSGTDVHQLESALERLGFDPGPVDGAFDDETATAVVAWYAAAGWHPAAPSAGYRAELHQLELNLEQARDVLAAAEDRAAAAPLQVDAVRAQAEHANTVAAALVAAKLLQLESVSTNERAAADAEIAVAQAAATATELEGEVALQAVLAKQKSADRAVAIAKRNVTRLTAKLAAVERTVTGYVPADELIFVPTLPVRVESLHATIGDPAQGTVLMVTNDQLAVDSQLLLAEASLVKPGMPVTIDEPDLGVQATGTVVLVADNPGTNGVDSYHVYFETAIEETSTTIDGFSLRMSIPVQSTDGAVTVVPISALSLKANGQSIVQVEHNGVLEPLVVEPGLSADGFVEVRAVDGQLDPGQLVLVGYEMAE